MENPLGEEVDQENTVQCLRIKEGVRKKSGDEECDD